jgi:micrococcal nuclease
MYIVIAQHCDIVLLCSEQCEEEKALRIGKRKQMQIASAFATVVIAIAGFTGYATTAQQSTDSALEQASVIRVVDGDTFVANVNGTEEKIRLIGVDTPESVHPDKSKNTKEGKEASEYTKSMLQPGTKVWLEADVEKVDKYNRELRYVWLKEPKDSNSEVEAKSKMLNMILVEDGWADPLKIEPNTKWAYLFEELDNAA